MEQSPEDSRIPVVEETARFDKSEVVTGKVTVRTITRTIEQEVSDSLLSRDVEITRVTVNMEVSAPPEVRTVDGVLIVPVLEERLVVEKRLFLKEELHIRQRESREIVGARVPVRKQEVVIERSDVEHTPTDERP